MNRLRLGLLLSAAVVSAPWIANAQDTGRHQGWYASLGAGLNILRDSDLSGGNYHSTAEFDRGVAGIGAVGYSFGHVRLEGELGVRRNTVDTISNPGGEGHGRVWGESLMANVLYDFLPASRFSPYVGVGGGVAHLKYGEVGSGATTVADDSDNVFAYQGIAGVRYDLNYNWSLNADYRYFATQDPSFSSTGATTPATSSVDSEYRNHTILVGVTYHFGHPQQPMPVAAAAPPPPPPAPAPVVEQPKPVPQVYLVFFDFGKANVSPVAAQVLDRAIEDFNKTGAVTFDVRGYADRAGTDTYNEKLSERRADAVKKYVLSHGVQASNIKTAWFGENNPRVQTPDGVRNQENRRAEIYLTK